jgi:hypothetical protein
MLVVPFEPWHLKEVELRTRDMMLSGYMNDEKFAQALAGFPGKTGFHDGKVLGCAGLIPASPGRAVVWLVLSDDARGLLMVPVHRAVIAWLDTYQQDPIFKRVETTVRCDFPIGLRWAKMLGFSRASRRLRSYDMYGHDHYLYERVRLDG